MKEAVGVTFDDDVSETSGGRDGDPSNWTLDLGDVVIGTNDVLLRFETCVNSSALSTGSATGFAGALFARLNGKESCKGLRRDVNLKPEALGIIVARSAVGAH